MTGVEGLGAGTVFADTFIGNDAANTLLGDAGDTVTANDGDDAIFIGGAPAIVDGGAGVDTLSLGQTTLQPDNNSDGAAEEVIGDAGYTVNLQAGVIADQWGGVGSVVGVENVNGAGVRRHHYRRRQRQRHQWRRRRDIIVGNGGSDTINGGDGNDQLRGDGGPSLQRPVRQRHADRRRRQRRHVGRCGRRYATMAATASTTVSASLPRRRRKAHRPTSSRKPLAMTASATSRPWSTSRGLGAGTAYADTFIGNDAFNFMYAGFGDTTIGNGGDDIIYMDRAPAVIDGGDGFDTIGFIGDTSGSLVIDNTGDGLAETIFATAGVYVDLLAQYIYDDGFGNEVAISGFENVEGSELGDTIIGENGFEHSSTAGAATTSSTASAAMTVIDGGEGSDQLRGDGDVRLGAVWQ